MNKRLPNNINMVIVTGLQVDLNIDKQQNIMIFHVGAINSHYLLPSIEHIINLI